jgi:selenium metabolism protein YedF
MKRVDTVGLRCPQPLMLLKEALQTLEEGNRLAVVTDSDTSLKNMLAYLKENGVDPEVTTDGKLHTIVTGRTSGNLEEVDPSAYCDNDPTGNDYAVCIRSELMGEGDPALGRLLMETFLENLKLQEQLPTHIVLYNSGVNLATRQSPVCSSLTELEELGTRIMLCGTCVDHYGVQYDIAVGMISNMVSLTEILASAGHVVYP